MRDRRVYLATRKVRHIGVFASAERWQESCRALCDRPVAFESARMLSGLWPVARADPRWSLPICKRCDDVAAIVIAAAMDVPESCVVEVITADWLAS